MNQQNLNTIWDVVVIGGGPAGMMAAGAAAERGKTVLLLEKNASLGKKLLITGGGRCNVTNYKPEVSTLVNSYKNSPKALYSVFSQFDVNATLQFFNSRGMATKIEAENRVFPTSDKAQSVWDVLNSYITNQQVSIQTNSAVTAIEHNKQSGIFTIQTTNAAYNAKACIVATGGTSHPETGSTGDGFKWLKALGHTINANSFALVPVTIKEKWVKDLAGVTLQDIKISVIQYGKRQESKKGKLLFTHVGISGPTVLNMSSKIGELLQDSDVTIELDLQPELDHGALRTQINNVLAAENNKKIKNTLGNIIPSSVVTIILQLANVDPEKQNNSVTKQERMQLVQIIKAMPLTVKGLLGADKAIVSSGGVSIDEVDFKTMQSKLVPNLFIIGDVLDIDRPSGGYSLQLCWSQGWVAGGSC